MGDRGAFGCRFCLETREKARKGKRRLELTRVPDGSAEGVPVVQAESPYWCDSCRQRIERDAKRQREDTKENGGQGGEGGGDAGKGSKQSRVAAGSKTPFSYLTQPEQHERFTNVSAERTTLSKETKRLRSSLEEASAAGGGEGCGSDTEGGGDGGRGGGRGGANRGDQRHELTDYQRKCLVAIGELDRSLEEEGLGEGMSLQLLEALCPKGGLSKIETLVVATSAYNSTRPSNNHKYPDSVKHFAASLLHSSGPQSAYRLLTGPRGQGFGRAGERPTRVLSNIGGLPDIETVRRWAHAQRPDPTWVLGPSQTSAAHFLNVRKQSEELVVVAFDGTKTRSGHGYTGRHKECFTPTDENWPGGADARQKEEEYQRVVGLFCKFLENPTLADHPGNREAVGRALKEAVDYLEPVEERMQEVQAKLSRDLGALQSEEGSRAGREGDETDEEECEASEEGGTSDDEESLSHGGEESDEEGLGSSVKEGSALVEYVAGKGAAATKKHNSLVSQILESQREHEKVTKFLKSVREGCLHSSSVSLVSEALQAGCSFQRVAASEVILWILKGLATGTSQQVQRCAVGAGVSGADMALMDQSARATFAEHEKGGSVVGIASDGEHRRLLMGGRKAPTTKRECWEQARDIVARTEAAARADAGLPGGRVRLTREQNGPVMIALEELYNDYRSFSWETRPTEPLEHPDIWEAVNRVRKCSVAEEESTGEAMDTDEPGIFDGLRFLMVGDAKGDEELERAIEDNDGVVARAMSDKVTHLVASNEQGDGTVTLPEGVRRVNPALVFAKFIEESVEQGVRVRERDYLAHSVARAPRSINPVAQGLQRLEVEFNGDWWEAFVYCDLGGWLWIIYVDGEGNSNDRGYDEFIRRGSCRLRVCKEDAEGGFQRELEWEFDWYWRPIRDEDGEIVATERDFLDCPLEIERERQDVRELQARSQQQLPNLSSREVWRTGASSLLDYRVRRAKEAQDLGEMRRAVQQAVMNNLVRDAEAKSFDSMVAAGWATPKELLENKAYRFGPRLCIPQVYPQRNALDKPILLVPLPDQPHAAGRLAAFLRGGVSGRALKGKDGLLLDPKVLLSVAQGDHRFQLIAKVIRKLVDDQDKRFDKEVFLNVAFRQAVRDAGYPDMALVLEIFGGAIRASDEAGLSRAERRRLRGRMRALLNAAQGGSGVRGRAGPLPAHVLGLPLSVLEAFVVYFDSRDVLDSCFPSKPINDRNASTYSCEIVFSEVVQRLGYKPRTDLLVPVLQSLEGQAQRREDEQRPYCWPWSKKEKYNHSELARQSYEGPSRGVRAALDAKYKRGVDWHSGEKDGDGGGSHSAMSLGGARKGMSGADKASGSVRPFHAGLAMRKS